MANEAVKSARQVQIVEFGGLRLLVPLTKSTDEEVQRLAAHALANLSVNGTVLSQLDRSLPLLVYFVFHAADNQKLMADEGAIECLIGLLDSSNDLIQRQSAKALANLGVNADNKPKIAEAGGIPKLVKLAATPQISVRIEAIAAMANLAVNGEHSSVDLAVSTLRLTDPFVTPQTAMSWR